MNFFLIASLLVQSIIYIQARSISMYEDNGILICDMIQCPSDAYRCVVTRSNVEKRSVLKVVNKCLSKNNEVLAINEVTSATDPNNFIDDHIEYDRKANSDTSNMYNNQWEEDQSNKMEPEYDYSYEY